MSADEVHVWCTPLELTAPEVARLRQALAPEEVARSERYRFRAHRERFVVGRGLLRAILGRYLGVDAGQIRFRHGPYGKPELAGGGRLRFNMSHSHELALFAVACGREVGVDLERIRPDVADERIAERFFCAREAAAIRTLPEHLRKEAFFACWTRKEAYLKARGEGLSHGLGRFEVSVVPGEPALLSVDGDSREASRWSLHDLDAGPGYAAALAVEGEGWRLRCWQWMDPPLDSG